VINLPHVALAEKMKERDPFNCPVIGDRVPYVFIKGDPKLKQFEKVEDPVFSTNNMLSIDYLYYFEHQLKSVLETIFEVVIDDLADLFAEATALKPKKTRVKKTN
jgi:DNA polymerase elongation subunit (family B)